MNILSSFLLALIVLSFFSFAQADDDDRSSEVKASSGRTPAGTGNISKCANIQGVEICNPEVLKEIEKAHDMGDVMGIVTREQELQQNMQQGCQSAGVGTDSCNIHRLKESNFTEDSTKAVSGGWDMEKRVAECAKDPTKTWSGTSCISKSELDSPRPQSDNATSTASTEKQVNPFEACTTAHDEAVTACDTTLTSWMENININMVAQGVGPMFTANQGSCGSLAATNVGTTTSLATFKVMCNTAYQKCVAACGSKGDATAFLADSTLAREKLSNCQKIGVKSQQAQAQAVQATQQITAAVQACQAQFGNSYNSLAAQANMDYQAKLAESGNLQSGNNNPGMNLPGTGSASGAGGSTGNRGAPNLSALMEGEETTAKPHENKGTGEEVGGNKGGGRVAMNGGGGGNSSAGNGGARTGGSGGGLLSNILSGFFGGGGGGGFGGGRGGGSSSGSGWKSWFGGSDEKTAQAKTPDLRQFLPGGLKDPNRNRGIAGQWVGADGMSGPHANIWRMINNRYQYKRATLLP